MQKVEKTDKPWGYEKILELGNRVVMKEMRITKGKRMSLQKHLYKEEIVVVIVGYLIVWFSEKQDDFKILGQGESIHIKPGMVHRFGASDQGDVIILEASTPELLDVVRLADDFGRVT